MVYKLIYYHMYKKIDIYCTTYIFDVLLQKLQILVGEVCVLLKYKRNVEKHSIYERIMYR